jgi:amino acid efflux transporter
MSQLRRALSLRDGIVLAIGSIAGSGLLFLPSLTYAIAGREVLLSWLGTVLLWVPMLFMFTDMVRSVPDGSGIEGFVARGLGPHAAASVPILFLALFFIGMPAGVLVAGDFLARALGSGATRLLGALAILGAALVTNLLGIRAGAGVQNVVTWSVLGMGLGLIGLTVPAAVSHYDVVRPDLDLSSAGQVLSGIVAAFWTFAGFENLTFIAGEFRNPRRDFWLAMLIAFAAYGCLVVALTANLAGVIPREEVNQLSGLLQLAQTLSPRWLATWAVTLFALALLQINATSWVWGMSRLLYTSASAGRVPAYFGRLDSRDLPRRAVGCLGVVLLGVTCVFASAPWLLVEALITASSVFVVLYILCIVSYVRSERSLGKRIGALLLLLFLLTTLGGAGLRALYPLAVLALSCALSIVRGCNRLSSRGQLAKGRSLAEWPLREWQRRWRMARAPRSLQRMPERLRRSWTRRLASASTAPEPMGRPRWRKDGYCMRAALARK